MSENNHLWTAVAILGGIYAYSMLKEDAGKLKDGVVNIAKNVADGVNITKDTNLAYRGAVAVFGEDTIIDKVGGGIARILGTDPMKDYPKEKKSTPKPTASAPEIEYQSYNPRAANYRAKPKEAVKPKSTDAGLPARQFNGKWLKLVNKQWLPLTKSDKVFSVRGAYVVHHYLWKP